MRIDDLDPILPRDIHIDLGNGGVHADARRATVVESDLFKEVARRRVVDLHVSIFLDAVELSAVLVSRRRGFDPGSWTT
jgi:hypothetical protein